MELPRRVNAGARTTCMGLFLSSSRFGLFPVLCSERKGRSSSRRLRSGSRSARKGARPYRWCLQNLINDRSGFHRNRICADRSINGCRGDSRDCLSRHQPQQRLVLAGLLDSPLEGSGFELSVPLGHLHQTRPLHHPGRALHRHRRCLAGRRRRPKGSMLALVRFAAIPRGYLGLGGQDGLSLPVHTDAPIGA